MRRIPGRVAVVTGAASGIGLGLARAFASAEMKVVLADVRNDALQQAAAELRDGGGEVIAVPTDVTRLADVESLAQAALDTFGRVNVLCNNAGVSCYATIANTTVDEWRWVLDVDLWGPIHGIRTFLPIIEREEEGHINSTSSMSGLLAGPRLGAYNVAKHGVVALMTTLERELRATRSPVRTSVLCPEFVNTGIRANSDEIRSRAGLVAVDPGSLGPSVEGIDPDEVGRLVLDAIRDDRFWIFTSRELLPSVERQVAAMKFDCSLSRLRPPSASTTGDDDWPPLRVPERVIPVPKSISEDARRYLVSQRFPAQVHPAVDDAAAWLARRKVMDEAMLDRLQQVTTGIDVEVREDEVGRCRVFQIIPPRATGRRAYMFIHGGGMTMGGGECCRLFGIQKAAMVGETVWAIDYRMPPEDPYPAALDDCAAVYRALLDDHLPREIAIGGGSAGGNLAAATILRARDEALPLPAAAILVSPEVDLTESGDTFHTNLGVDTVLVEPLMRANLLYANGHDLGDPYLSPLFGDFTKGFSPTLIVSGTRDLFLSNAVRMHRALCQAGVPAELHVFEAAPHGMPLRVGTPEEADLKRQTMKFLATYWGSNWGSNQPNQRNEV